MDELAASLALKVYAKREIATEIYEFDLRPINEEELPAFTAGAHISVQTPSGRLNKYSLCNAPNERHRYVIAIKRDAQGKGGSISMADELQQSAVVEVFPPKNVFELTSIRPEYIFIAGGIGITPIYSMMQALRLQGISDFSLYYLSRNAEGAAYLSELTSEKWGNQVVVHHNGGDPNNWYDLWPVLENPKDKQVYCCGPMSLMEEVKAMTGHWSKGTVNFESFGTDAATARTNVPFQVRLEKSGNSFEVDAQTSLLEALTVHGIKVPSSCESGTCGSCKTRLVSGDIEHRDMVLSEDEQEQYIMVCVSRGCGAETVILDL